MKFRMYYTASRGDHDWINLKETFSASSYREAALAARRFIRNENRHSRWWHKLNALCKVEKTAGHMIEKRLNVSQILRRT